MQSPAKLSDGAGAYPSFATDGLASGGFNPRFSPDHRFRGSTPSRRSALKGRAMTENPSTTLHGTVEKIITSRVASEPEKAQISINGADDLYKQLRIENKLTDVAGNEVRLNRGATVEITVKAETHTVSTKNDRKIEIPEL
jgi:hypothetical protein